MSTTLLYQPFTASIAGLNLDASVKEEHGAELDVTEFPVEQGVAITDHARPKPRELTIEGVVSNTPINTTQTRSATTTAGTIVQTTNQTVDVRGQPGYAEGAYQILLDLYTNPQLVTVVTQLETYTDMVMVSLKVPRDAQVGDVLKFTAKFRNVRLVTNSTTMVATKQPKAQKKASKGSVATTPAPAPAASNLYKTSNGIPVT